MESADGAISDALLWRDLLESDETLAAPNQVTDTPIHPALELLPTTDMTWPDFERLLVRVSREVLGLRQVRLFGTPGQRQEGLDLVGIEAADTVVGVQGKKYQRFTTGDLEKAVSKFLDGTVPFQVRKLNIGVSSRANSTQVTTRLTELNLAHVGSVEFELWDQDRLSEMLRSRPEIVREFFGQATAVRFCGPVAETPHPVPSPEAVGVAEAIARGPIAASGAQAALDSAERNRTADPDAALDYIQIAQSQLRESGFPAHAQLLEKTVVDILAQASRHADAAALLVEAVWRSLDEDHTNQAHIRLGQAKDLAAQADDAIVTASVAVAERAVQAAQNPMGDAPALDSIPPSLPDREAARIYLLAGEMRLAQGDRPFSQADAQAVQQLLSSGTALDDSTIIRLRLCLSESDDDWEELVSAARRRKLSLGARALVLARHARHCALDGRYEEADEDWDDAIVQACLGKYNGDASNWLYSQRMLSMRYLPFEEDRFHPLASALDAMGGQPPLASAAGRPREHALSALNDGKLRVAAIRMQRFLRDAVTSGNWSAETEARNMLANVYRQTGDLRLAAHHIILAGNAKEAHDLGSTAGDNYLDVTTRLDMPTYWTRAAAFRLIAAQSDLVPDDAVSRIAEQALTTIEQITNGQLRDSALFGPHAHLAAHEALAGLSERLTKHHADKLLELLEPLARVDQPNQYRHTDKSQAIACTGIGRAHSELAQRAVGQLLILLERAGHAVSQEARRLIANHLDYSRAELQRQREAGHIAAAEVLALHESQSVSAEDAEQASESLLAELQSRPGLYSIGTRAVHDSILAVGLSAERRADLIRNQIKRCGSRYESVHNRCDYLLAASNLSDQLAQDDIDEIFPAVIAMTSEATISEADESDQMFAHPLGAMRVMNFGDDRPMAALLAANLASTLDQRTQAINAALSLTGTSDDADYWTTKALQILSDDLAADVLPVLARMNWPQRSLAAITWCRNDESPASLGDSLAGDTDVRVRRAFAEAISARPCNSRTNHARELLTRDVRYSVRRALMHADAPTEP